MNQYLHSMLLLKSYLDFLNFLLLIYFIGRSVIETNKICIEIVKKKSENHSPMHTNIGTKTKLKSADGFKFPTEQIPVNRSPSIVFVTRIIIARNAGMPQART